MLARHPFVFSVDNNEYQSFVNAFRKVAEGSAGHLQHGALSPAALAEGDDVRRVGVKAAPDSGRMEAKVKTWNEALTLLGIMNVNSEKRSAWWLASGSSGSGPGDARCRHERSGYACEHINKMYDLQVDVRWNLDESQPADAQNAMLRRGRSRGYLVMLSTRGTRIWTTDQQELNPNNG